MVDVQDPFVADWWDKCSPVDGQPGVFTNGTITFTLTTNTLSPDCIIALETYVPGRVYYDD